MPGYIYEPSASDGVTGPIVLIPDIYGTVPFYQNLSVRLAQAGHPTLLVDIFYRYGALPEMTRHAAFERLSDLDALHAVADCSEAVDMMKDLYGRPRTAVLGFCLGGQFAMVLCAQRDDVVAVSYYGFPEGVSAPVRVAAPRPIDLADRMMGPVLAFWGEDDYIGLDVMKRFGDAMRQHDADYDVHIFPATGHGFLQGLVEDRADSEAATDAWRRTLSFLGDRVGS